MGSGHEGGTAAEAGGGFSALVRVLGGGGLIMVDQGLGWIRSWGGSGFWVDQFLESAGAEHTHAERCGRASCIWGLQVVCLHTQHERMQAQVCDEQDVCMCVAEVGHLALSGTARWGVEML